MLFVNWYHLINQLRTACFHKQKRELQLAWAQQWICVWAQVLPQWPDQGQTQEGACNVTGMIVIGDLPSWAGLPLLFRHPNRSRMVSCFSWFLIFLHTHWWRGGFYFDHLETINLIEKNQNYPLMSCIWFVKNSVLQHIHITVVMIMKIKGKRSMAEHQSHLSRTFLKHVVTSRQRDSFHTGSFTFPLLGFHVSPFQSDSFFPNNTVASQAPFSSMMCFTRWESRGQM